MALLYHRPFTRHTWDDWGLRSECGLITFCIYILPNMTMQNTQIIPLALCGLSLSCCIFRLVEQRQIPILAFLHGCISLVDTEEILEWLFSCCIFTLGPSYSEALSQRSAWGAVICWCLWIWIIQPFYCVWPLFPLLTQSNIMVQQSVYVLFIFLPKREHQHSISHHWFSAMHKLV